MSRATKDHIPNWAGGRQSLESRSGPDRLRDIVRDAETTGTDAPQPVTVQQARDILAALALSMAREPEQETAAAQLAKRARTVLVELDATIGRAWCKCGACPGCVEIDTLKVIRSWLSAEPPSLPSGTGTETAATWLPIESAPKTHIPVLVYLAGTAGLGVYRAIWFNAKGETARWRPHGYAYVDEFPTESAVTHWMPLPPAPR